MQAAGALGPRHPDFVHSGDRRRALWLSGNAVPPEVHKVVTTPAPFTPTRSLWTADFSGMRAVVQPPGCAHHLNLCCLLGVSDRWAVLVRAPALCTSVV